MSKNTKLDKPSKAIQDMRRRWGLLDDLMQGNEAMRQWLLQEPAENDRNYINRSKNTTLFNGLKNTVKTNVGKVFSQNIAIDDNVHPLIRLMLDNVDMESRDINNFAKEVLKDGLVHGLSCILVDYTALTPSETLLDEATERPYWVHIKSEQLLEVRSEVINGKECPVYLRFMEYVVDYNADGDEIEYTQVKVMKYNSVTKLINWECHRSQKKDAAYQHVGSLAAVQQSTSNDWALYEQGEIAGLPFVPIVPFYAERAGFFKATPPLSELAETNLAHYRSSSDQRNILHIARVPMLMVKGYDDVDPATGQRNQIVISPNTVLNLGNDPAADAKWIEHGGQAIQAGRDDLHDLEDQMAVQGLELTVSRSGDMTATEKTINTAAANSQLKSMAMNLEDAIEIAMKLSAIYFSVPIAQAGNININTDFTVAYQGDASMSAVFDMYNNGMISAADVVDEAKRRSILHPERTVVSAVIPPVAEAPSVTDVTNVITQQETIDNGPEE
tara:strand:- start:1507 stop:3009 length:1503 start_codon:yes stop_codon:yes gene_type:complete